MSEGRYALDDRLVDQSAFYAAACDPRRHVVVEACAGAGKTWMLVARIVRALLEGARPESILAITFTRKAAGEMRTRLLDALRECAALDAAAAAQRLRAYGLAPVEAERRAPALIGLHAAVLAADRPVEIHTFHAWYTRLMAAAPRELLQSIGLAPGLTPLEDIDDLRAPLMRAFHAAVMNDEALAQDYRDLTLRHGRFQLARWFATALERRGELELADEAGVLEASVPPAADPQAICRVMQAAFEADARDLARKLGMRSGALAQGAARAIVEALDIDDAQARYVALRGALFTAKGTPKQRMGDSREQAALCGQLDAIEGERQAQQAHEDHHAMARLTRRLFAEYAQLKRRRGVLDMGDLERVALALLSEHELAAWVQERLDARVRHLLIDEFQDTSPLQWHALHGWLAAYAGAGGGAQEAPRVFIVGDPKQSIYRFRRAEPRVFAAAQAFVVQALGGIRASCDHTRRCAPALVSALNRVFGAQAAEQPRADGATEARDAPAWRPHTTERDGPADAAAVWALPSIDAPAPSREPPPDTLRWRPSLTEPRDSARVAQREPEAAIVAQTVRRLVDHEGVAPADILLLARKRVALDAAEQALAALGIPSVAPDHARLVDAPEVQDLLAALDVLASPEQDLALARALKSPLFGASDEALLALARRAREAGGWWPALMACGDDAPQALRTARDRFGAWQAAAQVLPPHDLLDRIVHECELPRRLAEVVPPRRRAQAHHAVQSLLAAALDLDGGRHASAYRFVRALRQRAIALPAAAREDAVRLMTIHRAKGLEAPVVFLLDADPAAPRTETATVLVDWPVAAQRPLRAAFLASESRCPPQLAVLLAREQTERTREENNALYVAMTRAEDRLFVSRTPPRGEPRTGSWWARLAAVAQAVEHDAARDVDGPVEAAETAVAYPDLDALRRIPLSPQPPSPQTDRAHDPAAARFGQAVHRLLQWIADEATIDTEPAARAAALEFGVADHPDVARVARAILASPACRAFFDARACAWVGNEVPVSGPQAQPWRIDRLVQLRAGGTWWVLDYKLAGDPAADPALRAQLAGYRDAVRRRVGDAPVRAAFITAAGALIEPD